MHALEEIAELVALHREGSIDSETRRAASLLVADLMAATAAGLNSNLAKAARAAAKQLNGAGDAQVWMTGERLGVAGAAVANAAAASALDIDDGHRGAAGHAGAGIIPATFATAQILHSSDDRIFDALALGYEVALRIGTSRPTSTIETYSSGRWVGYGVAAAASRLLGLNARQTANAMAIAGAEGPISFPTGTSRYQGSTVKEGIPPAVQAGLTGAFRAAANGTGPLDLLDNPDRFDRATLTEGWGERWWLRDCYTKPYACCRYMHAAVDGILALRDPNAPFVSLRIETFPTGLRLANERAPHSLEGGQYSYYFSCAVAAIHGGEALQPVSSEMLADPKVLELASRIELVAHEDFAYSFPKSTPCRVIMDQGDGPKTATVLHPLGDVANPMDREQIFTKFNRIGSVNVEPESRQRIRLALDAITTDGFRPLMVALDREDERQETSRGEL